jgi:hypothetical protein
MTDERFDALTRTLGKATSRRTVFKGLVAAAAGAVLTRAGGNDAEARARIRTACARLGQACGAGTVDNQACCPSLTCGDELTCCKDTNQTCIANDDCCGDNTCRPNPTGLGNRCLPPGDAGAECVEDLDCAAGLICDPYTGTCAGELGAPCTSDADCVSGVCDVYTGICVAGNLPNGAVCADSAQCESGSCCPPEGVCKPPANQSAACVVDDDCCGTDICSGGVCFSCANPYQYCGSGHDCCSGVCNGSLLGICGDYDTTCGTTTCPHVECMDTVCDAGTSTCGYVPTSNGLTCGTSGFATCQEGVCTEQCHAAGAQCDTADQCCDAGYICDFAPLESIKRCLAPLT